jgi:ABC-type enterochelin transport system permease subunit
MNTLKELQSLGLTLPSTAYIVGCIIFSIVGFIAYRYGKKMAQPITKWLGVALMFYPYVISDTLMLYVVGAGLCVAAYVYRK